jgi:hypothetical protein
MQILSKKITFDPKFLNLAVLVNLFLSRWRAEGHSCAEGVVADGVC